MIPPDLIDRPQLAGLDDTQRRAVLEKAQFAALSRAPATPEAKALVDAVASRLESLEGEIEARQRQRGKAADRFRQAVGAFLADLLMAPGGGTFGGLVHRANDPDAFTGEAVGYRQFAAVRQGLERLELVEVFKGYGVPGPFGRPQGRATRFRATPALLAWADQWCIDPATATDHFEALPTSRAKLLVTLKAASVWDGGTKISGPSMKVAKTQKVGAISDQVARINDFLATVAIRGAEAGPFVRGFYLGDAPGFAWDRGGRLYSQSAGGDYQRLPQAERLQMTLDGEPVVEIDIRASYLTIAHALAGEAYDPGADAYRLPGFEDERGRAIVKGWTATTLAKGAPPQRWPKRQLEEYAKSFGRNLSADFKVRAVTDAAVSKYPLLGRLEVAGLDWSVLMYRESEIILRTILSLIDTGTPSLPVHDSLIVPASKEGLAVDLLRSSFMEEVGVAPALKVNRHRDPPTPLAEPA